MLLNTYYYNINYFVSSLMCLDYNRKYYILAIYYKLHNNSLIVISSYKTFLNPTHLYW